MAFWVAILLGIIQGFTEFLPISSSGHLLAISKLLGAEQDSLALNILLHFGSALAIIICYRKKLFEYVKKPFDKNTLMLLFGISISIFIAGIFKLFFEKFLLEGLVGFGFAFTAVYLSVAMILVKRREKHKNIVTQTSANIIVDNDTAEFKTIIGMCIAQGLAVLPGISRSGSTISTGIVLSKNNNKIADISFIISLPVIIVGALFELIFEFESILSIGILQIVLGFVASFICSIFAIKLMQRVIKKTCFLPFIIYLIFVSIFSFIGKI